MKLFSLSLFVLFWGCSSHPTGSAPAPFQVYPRNPNEPVSSLFQVAVNQQSSPVYVAQVQAYVGYSTGQPTLGQAAFTSFDMTTNAQITVTYSQPITSVLVLPSSRGIAATGAGSGQSVTFTISQPGQYVVEVNGDKMNSLQIFANPFEANPPSSTTANVVSVTPSVGTNPAVVPSLTSGQNTLYFGPGTYYIDSTVNISSNQNVYVANGAIIYAMQPPSFVSCTSGPSITHIFSLVGSNINFLGRGIIDGSLITQGSADGSPISNNCTGSNISAQGNNINFEGVTLRAATIWNLHIYKSNNVSISNIKVLGYEVNGDGTDIDSSQNVTVSNSYYRNYDDLVNVKSAGAVSSNITVQNCVLWNERGHALGIDPTQNVQNVTFSNNDIIRDTGHDWLLAIINTNPGTVENTVFQNIRIEEARGLIALWIGNCAGATPASSLGQINSTTFSNIVSVAPVGIPAPSSGCYGAVGTIAAPAELSGYSSSAQISGVSFNSLVVGGSSFSSSSIWQNTYVSDVNVSTSATTANKGVIF